MRGYTSINGFDIGSVVNSDITGTYTFCVFELDGNGPFFSLYDQRVIDFTKNEIEKLFKKGCVSDFRVVGTIKFVLR